MDESLKGILIIVVAGFALLAICSGFDSWQRVEVARAVCRALPPDGGSP